MGETDETPDRDPGPETGTGTGPKTGTDTAPEPREGPPGGTPESGTTGYDQETVEAAVRDVEGIEYEEGGNVAGAAPGTDLGPVEPETPTLEGTLFVLLGVALTIVVLAQLVGF